MIQLTPIEDKFYRFILTNPICSLYKVKNSVGCGSSIQFAKLAEKGMVTLENNRATAKENAPEYKVGFAPRGKNKIK